MLNYFYKNAEISVLSQHHLIRYIKFINNINSKINKSISKSEIHHILPKSYFPEFEKTKWNLVNLSLREHYIAHQMLALAIGGRMWIAFQLMGRIKSHKSWHYKKFKEEALNINKCHIKRLKTSKTVKALWQLESYKQKQQDSRVDSSGLLNNNKAPVTIYDSMDNPIVTILYDLRNTLNSIGFPGQAFYTSLYSKQRLFMSERKSDIVKYEKIGYTKFKGWYAKHTIK